MFNNSLNLRQKDGLNAVLLRAPSQHHYRDHEVQSRVWRKTEGCFQLLGAKSPHKTSMSDRIPDVCMYVLVPQIQFLHMHFVRYFDAKRSL